MFDECDRCHQPAETLIAVEVCRATHWSPAEFSLYCEACIAAELERAEQIEERRGFSDEIWEHV